MPAEAALSFTSDFFPTSADARANEGALPLGVHLAPMMSRLEPQYRDPMRCEGRDCRAYANLFCECDDTSWRCVLCGRKNRVDGIYGLPLGQRPEFVDADVEYVLDSASSTYGDVTPPRVVLFVVDDHISSDALADLQEAVKSILQRLPSETYLGLLSFGSSVGAYKLSKTDGLEALMLDAEPLSSKDAQLLQQQAALFVAPSHAAADQLMRGLRAFEPPPPLPSELGDCLTPLLGQAQTRRCLGSALEVAMHLAKGLSPSAPAHVDVIATLCGTVNHGLGALPTLPSHATYEHDLRVATSALRGLGHRLCRSNVAVHLQCAGSHAFGTAALRAMLLPCGGSLSLERSPGKSSSPFALSSVARLTANLSAILLPASRHSLAASAVLSVYCTRGILPAALIGGAVALDDADADAEGDSSHVIAYLGSLSERTRLSLALEVESQLEGVGHDDRHVNGYAVVQVVLRYISEFGEARLRLMTARVPLAESEEKVLKSIRAEVAVDLLAKQLLLQATKRALSPNTTLTSVSSQLELGIDATASALVQMYGSRVEAVTKGWLWNYRVTVGYDISSQLLKLIEGLYRLRRSGITRMLGDEDAMEQQRLLLLTAPLDATCLLVAPRLATAQRDVALSLTPIPAIDLALHSEAILILDAHTDILLWRGSVVPADDRSFRELEQRSLAIALSRFPSAVTLSFSEGSSLERWLLCRLEPRRRDPPDALEEEKSPQGNMASEARQRLLIRLGHTDELSFREWAKDRGVNCIPV